NFTKYKGQIEITVSSLKPGLYFMEVITDKGTIIKKLLKK
ncbi:MAG: T9SS type A sorting domain-containing protein, partial [Flavobacteriaceae bacterium]|nr:T9SS type A sorting domain-containing protein [Flavobacteriaceae bacterium]